MDEVDLCSNRVEINSIKPSLTLTFWRVRWEGKYVSVCKARGKLEGSGGILPREILILDHVK